MSVKIEEYDTVCVMEIDGDFSTDNAQAVRTAFDQRTENRRIVDFVMDLTKCQFIDSEGLETLLAMKRRCEDMFGQVKLANVDDSCRTILHITRLEPRFELHDDLHAAMKTIRC